VRVAHLRAENNPTILRISIDCKARVKIGPFSRGCATRDVASQKAVDHDMAVTPTVTPCGILEVASGQLTIGMIVGTTTSDSIVDTLERWWQERKAVYPHVQTLMIDLDNGPDCQSHRTQFVHRITQFADSSGLRILLVYYPPYHSKYNPVERCWSALERHWNGALLTTIETSLKWVATMTWKQLRPIVWKLDNNYERGKTLTKSQMKTVGQRLLRLTGLERWCVMIRPVVVQMN
jgi:transposase